MFDWWVFWGSSHPVMTSKLSSGGSRGAVTNLIQPIPSESGRRNLPIESFCLGVPFNPIGVKILSLDRLLYWLVYRDPYIGLSKIPILIG